VKLLDLTDFLHTRRRNRAGGREPGRGVLLVSSGGLGDTVLFSLMAARFAGLTRSGEPVDLVVRDDTRAADFLYPENIRVSSYDYRKFLRNPIYRYQVQDELFAKNYRVAVSTDHLRHPLIDDVFINATAAEIRAAMEPRSWPKYDSRFRRTRGFYTRLVAVDPEPAHRLVRWWELANALTGGTEPIPRVRFPADRLPPPAGLDAPTVVLHPFSAIKERQYNPSVFRKILDAMPGDHICVLSAGPGDLARSPDFGALAADPRVRVDQSDFRQKAALMRAARLVVSVDTSLMHLAVGCGTKTICLASAANVVDSIPYDDRMIPENVEFLYHHMPCAGCLGTCTLALEDHRYPCIARMDDQDILDSVRRALSEHA